MLSLAGPIAFFDRLIIRSMLIRMTLVGPHIAAILAAGAVATGAAFGADARGAGDGATRTALVIDASLARDGRDLVDQRLENVSASVRLPRTDTEARTNARYFDALGYRVYVAGAHATAAAERTGVRATTVDGLDGALAAAR
jgi:hypothetical protein